MPSPLHTLFALILMAMALVGRAENIAPYQIVSGNLPPFTVESGDASPGALGTLVREMALRLGDAPPIQFYPWTRALTLVESQPRTLILPLTRTPERENSYRWLAKLYRHKFVFIALRKANINLDAMDTLRDLRVAVLRGSPNVAQLNNRHFSQIVPASSVQDMARMLERGMVDAVYGAEAINLAVLTDSGLPRASLHTSKPVGEGEIWLAGSLDIPESEAALWQNAMQQLTREGVVRRTLARYRLQQ